PIDHDPRRTVSGVPPCDRTIPAARLDAPEPTVSRSRTTTRSAPSSRANTDAQPPSVPAPTITRSALSRVIGRDPNACAVEPQERARAYAARMQLPRPIAAPRAPLDRRTLAEDGAVGR